MLAWKDGRSTIAKITVSAGVADWAEERGQTPPELVAEADARLYEAKSAGRNRVIGPAAILDSLPSR
jgi:PleD family two-component response regulator